jgi:hypothetical protein
MKKIRDTTIHEERAETQSRIQKARKQEISDTVKNPLKIGSTVEGHTQCRPRRKEGKNVFFDRIDSNKNTPDLRTLVTTHQSLAKNNLPERKNLAHSSDRRGLQTVKEDEILCSLNRTAHEIHYR